MSKDDYNPLSVDAALSRIETKLDDALAQQDKHDDRIAAVEKKQWWMSGAAAALAFIASKIFGKT